MLRDDETGRGYSSICQRDEITHDDFLVKVVARQCEGGRDSTTVTSRLALFPEGVLFCLSSRP